MFRSDGSTAAGHDGPDRVGPSARDAVAPKRRHGWVATDEGGDQRRLDEIAETPLPAPEVHRMAAAIATRLRVRPRARGAPVARGPGRLASVPYRFSSDDIDLDRTLDVLAERPHPAATDIVVRERTRSRRAVALVVDISGSMRGEKVRIAAATVAALAGDLIDDELAVIAFWKHAAVVQPLGRHRPAAQILDDLLRLPARGLTNVGFALSVASAELAKSRAREPSAILLSDAVHNAGPDPRPIAARLPRLDLLLELDGEHDRELATDLARLGGGQLLPIRGHRDVAPALNRILAR